MSELARNNHFVPQFYLRNWSDDGSTVYSYRILVSHEKVPAWSRVGIRSLGARTDLYTEVIGGDEVDEFEKWVKSEIEDPAVVAYDKLRADEDLDPEDWARLARFFAAQDLRTPASLLESLRRWKEEIPEMLSNALKEAVAEQRGSRHRRKAERSREPGMDEFGRTLRVRVDPDAPAPEGTVQLRAEITPGRSMWLASMKHLLTGVADRLQEHEWSIAEPHTGWEWITSDHPALKLNYNGFDDYTFGGGWGSTGTDLILPLTPRHLLFTQIGRQNERRLRFSLSKTIEIQKLLCERAHREVYARRPVRRVEWFRPRTVDAAMVKAEEEEWAKWHPEQAAVEAEPRAPAAGDRLDVQPLDDG
jgi:hypothetical protein